MKQSIYYSQKYKGVNTMLEALLSDDTEYDVFDETYEFIIEQELEIEQEAEEELIFGECDDMDILLYDDDETVSADDDVYYDEVDDDDDII